MLAGCGGNRPTAAAATAPQKMTISTATATSRTVPASFEETGTFAADETSDIAPMVAGRVLTTPVNVGDFVKLGQVVCELDHRDAELRLEQARAQLNEATSAMHQA
jgi:multidrug efflux pump subunit AcrA (membrane-fusion protein)